MNCLGSRRGRYDFNLAEPSAPSYYPPQLPYNPDFIEEPIEFDEPSILEPGYVWRTYENEFYIGNTFENNVELVQARRSLYEGVNCMPVSSPACIERAALSNMNCA